MADQQQYDTYGPAVTRRGRTPIQFGDEDPGVSAVTYANPDIPTMLQGGMDAIRYHDPSLIPFGQSIHIDPNNRDNTDMGNTVRHEDIHSIVNPLGDYASGADVPGYQQLQRALQKRGRASGPFEVPAYVGSNDTQNLQIDPAIKQQYWKNYVNKISAKDPAAGAKLKRFRSTNMPDQDDDQTQDQSTLSSSPNGADAATTSNNTARYKALLAGLGGGMAGAMNATGPSGRPRGPQINPSQFGSALAGLIPNQQVQNAPMPPVNPQSPGMPQGPMQAPPVGAAPAAQAAQPIQQIPGAAQDPNQFAPPPMARGGNASGWFANAGTGIAPPMSPPTPMAQGGTTVGVQYPPKPAPQAIFDSSWTRTPPNPALPTMANGGAAYGSFADTPMGQAAQGGGNGGSAAPYSQMAQMQQPAQQSQQQNSPGLARYGSQGSQQPSQQSFGDGGGGSGGPRGWSGGQMGPGGGSWGGGGQGQWGGQGGGIQPQSAQNVRMYSPGQGNQMGGVQSQMGGYQPAMNQQAQSQLMMGNGGQPLSGFNPQQQAMQTQQMNQLRMAQQQQPVQSYGFGGNMPPGGQMGGFPQMQAGGGGGMAYGGPAQPPATQGPSLASQGSYNQQGPVAGGSPSPIRNGYNPRAGQPTPMAGGGVIDGGLPGMEPPKAEAAMRRYSPIGPRNPAPMMTPAPENMGRHLPRRMSLAPKLNVKLPRPKIPSPTAK